MYSFYSKTASRRYHVYRNSTRQNKKVGRNLKVEKETKNKLSKSINPYACTIKINHQLFHTWLNVEHIPREISHHYYCFIEEGSHITGHLMPTTYKVFPIPAGCLKVPLLLTFYFKSKKIFKIIKDFVNALYE